MSMRLALACAAASLLAASSLISLAAGASAQERVPIIKSDWACGKPVELTPELTAFMDSTYVFSSFSEGMGEDDPSGVAALPSFIAGTLKDPAGGQFSMLYVDTPDGWKVYPVQAQGGFSNVFVSDVTGRAVLFSMMNVEGPGQDYTVLSTDDGFKTVTCGELPAPATELGTTDYMSIEAFALGADGKGSLRGYVSFGDGTDAGGTRKGECFEAATPDGGKTWTKPAKVEPCIDNQVYQMDPAPAPQLDDTLAALRAQSGM